MQSQRTALRHALACCALTLELAFAAAYPATAAGVDRAAMDTSVVPGDDFYRYANGHWLATTTIPADRSSWGPFAILDDRVSELTRARLEHADPAKAKPDVARAIRYYRAYLDEAAIESAGLAPLKDALTAIDGIQDAAGLTRALGEGVRADVDPLNATNFATRNFLGLWVAPGLHDTSTYTAYLLQGGLSLPDREYYLADTPKMAEIRTKFKEHAQKMFVLAGIDHADTRIDAVFDLEKRIAAGHSSREDSEDVLKADHVWTRADFTAEAPGLDWDLFLQSAGLGGQARINIWHPAAIAAEAKLVKEVPVEVWRDWLRLHLLDSYASMLPKAFSDEAFAFYGTALSGVPQQRPRWKRALSATNRALGDVVGQMYVEDAFPPASKARAQDMVRRIVAAFDQRVAKLAWMEPSTRAEARAKLKTLYVGIGYPDHWQSYQGLEIRDNDPVGNTLRTQVFHRDSRLALLGRPVDRAEWCMVPQEVNAVNLPVQNALNFPAAILQPPYFDAKASDAANYGAIGAIIGHEISHSFDDQGAQFDSKGALRNWWTPQDLAHFKEASAKLVQQFSAYRPFPDVAVNGQQTLSENIADVAGLSAAYDALKTLPVVKTKVKVRKGKRTTTRLVADTKERDNEFFLSFAQSWKQLERDQALRQQLVVDGHAPAMYRARTVRNLDGWYDAFGVAPGQALYLAPGDRVKVW